VKHWERMRALSRRAGITKGLYPPAMGWERLPLETLPGRNHYDFPASE
jgi:hypothetical protein